MLNKYNETLGNECVEVLANSEYGIRYKIRIIVMVMRYSADTNRISVQHLGN